MNRRKFITITSSIGVVGIAGCTSMFDQDPPGELDGVDPDPSQLPRPELGTGSVNLNVYEDLGCPACHDFNNEMFPQIEEQLINTNTVTYRHFDFPVMAADESVRMANAARAVQDETRSEDDPNGAFFEYKRSVFGLSEWSDESLASEAENYDVDPDTVLEALEDETYYPQILADVQRAHDIGASSTPTVTVEGVEVDPFDMDEIQQRVDAEQ